MAFGVAEVVGKRKLRAAVYIRVSTEEQAQNQTYKIQEEVIKRFVETRSHELEFAGDDFWFRDNGVSGATDIEERPSLSLLMDYVRTYPREYMPFDVVLVYKLDRFARSLLILLGILSEFQDKELSFISATEPFDTSTPMGKMCVQMIGSFAEMERSLIQERTWMGIEKSIREGKWRHDIYGYRKDTSKRPQEYKPEADVVREIFDSYIKGISPTDIAKTLTERQITVPGATNPKKITKMVAKRPTLWFAKTVKGILDNEVYTGKYYYNKTKRVIDVSTIRKGTQRRYKTMLLDQAQRLLSPASHEIIIPESVFFKAREIFSQNLHIGQRGRQIAKRYLLSPYLRCDYCKEHRHQSGLSHWKGSTSNGVTQYMCNKKHTGKNKGGQICTVVPISKKYLDNFVLSRIKEIFDNPKAIATYLHGNKSKAKHQKHYTNELSRIESSISSQEMKKERVKEMYIDNLIKPEERNTRLLAIDNRIKELLEQKLHMESKLAGVYEAQKYVDTFEKLRELVSTNIDEYFKDEDKVASLLNVIIHEIIVYSRPAVPEDRVSGRKTGEGKQQAVPYHVKIVFNLPQEILASFISGDDDNLWAGGDASKGPKKGPSIRNDGNGGMRFRDKDGKDHPFTSNNDIDWGSGMLKNVTSTLQHFTKKYQS